VGNDKQEELRDECSERKREGVREAADASAQVRGSRRSARRRTRPPAAENDGYHSDHPPVSRRLITPLVPLPDPFRPPSIPRRFPRVFLFYYATLLLLITRAPLCAPTVLHFQYRFSLAAGCLR